MVTRMGLKGCLASNPLVWNHSIVQAHTHPEKAIVHGATRDCLAAGRLL